MASGEKQATNIVGDIVNPGRNGGTLKRGNPGNKGGTGRPSDEIRQRCRGSFDERIRVAEEICDNPGSADDTRLKALGILGTYGLGTKTEITLNNEQALIRCVHIVVKYTPTHLRDDAIKELKQAFAE